MMQLWGLWQHDMDHAPISARNVHAFFEAAKKVILQDMAIMRDLPGFDIIARLPGLENIFFSQEFEAFKAQVISQHKQYAGMNLESMERLNVMVSVCFCCLLVLCIHVTTFSFLKFELQVGYIVCYV